MRLIDAGALIQNHFSDEHRIALGYADKLWMRRIINNEPTIDAVPVVRCKDCKHWDKNEGECSYWYGFRENDFCRYGERKEEEQ